MSPFTFNDGSGAEQRTGRNGPDYANLQNDAAQAWSSPCARFQPQGTASFTDNQFNDNINGALTGNIYGRPNDGMHDGLQDLNTASQWLQQAQMDLVNGNTAMGRRDMEYALREMRDGSADVNRGLNTEFQNVAQQDTDATFEVQNGLQSVGNSRYDVQQALQSLRNGDVNGALSQLGMGQSDLANGMQGVNLGASWLQQDQQSSDYLYGLGQPPQPNPFGFPSPNPTPFGFPPDGSFPFSGSNGYPGDTFPHPATPAPPVNPIGPAHGPGGAHAPHPGHDLPWHIAADVTAPIWVPAAIAGGAINGAGHAAQGFFGDIGSAIGGSTGSTIAQVVTAPIWAPVEIAGDVISGAAHGVVDAAGAVADGVSDAVDWIGSIF